MISRKLLGVIFFIAGVTGAVFCIVGMVQVWRVKPSVERIAGDTLEVTLQTLAATESGLDVIDDLIRTTSTDIAVVETSIHTLTAAIEDTGLVLDSLTTLTGSDLPATISATQTSLVSAQTSAALIDDLLSTLTRIPLLRLGVYQPEVPLSDALGEISTSLDPLTPSLDTISASLDGTSKNLSQLETELDRVAGITKEIGAALEDAGDVIGEYQVVVADITSRMENMQRVASANIRTLTWILTGLLVSILFPQFGLAERGLQLTRESKESTSENIDD